MEAEAQREPLGDHDFWTQGLDRKFFGRVYTRSSQLGAFAALAALGMEQKAVALGLLCGLGMGLFTLWTAEAAVRLLFKGGSHAGWKLGFAALVKLPFLGAGLAFLAWAANTGWINAFALVLGILMTHAVMLVMTISTALAYEDRNQERYR